MEGICQVGAWWMVRRLPRGRTMGYGCPPPLAGGGVPPSNADTRVITALLGAATEGGKQRRAVRAERWGMLYAHTWTFLQAAFHTVLFLHKAAENSEWTYTRRDNEICMLICWVIDSETPSVSHPWRCYTPHVNQYTEIYPQICLLLLLCACNYSCTKENKKMYYIFLFCFVSKHLQVCSLINMYRLSYS